MLSTSSVEKIPQIVSNFSITSDLAVLLVLFLFFLIYGFYLGKARIVSLILAFYPALFLYSKIPFYEKIIFLHSPKLELLNKVGIFVILLVIFDIIINRYIFAESDGGPKHFGSLVLFSVAAVVLCLVFDYSVLNLDLFHNFASQIDKVFATEYLFWWQLLPLGILFVL